MILNHKNAYHVLNNSRVTGDTENKALFRALISPFNFPKVEFKEDISGEMNWRERKLIEDSSLVFYSDTELKWDRYRSSDYSKYYYFMGANLLDLEALFSQKTSISDLSSIKFDKVILQKGDVIIGERMSYFELDQLNSKNDAETNIESLMKLKNERHVFKKVSHLDKLLFVKEVQLFKSKRSLLTFLDSVAFDGMDTKDFMVEYVKGEDIQKVSLDKLLTAPEGDPYYKFRECRLNKIVKKASIDEINLIKIGHLDKILQPNLKVELNYCFKVLEPLINVIIEEYSDLVMDEIDGVPVTLSSVGNLGLDFNCYDKLVLWARENVGKSPKELNIASLAEIDWRLIPRTRYSDYTYNYATQSVFVDVIVKLLTLSSKLGVTLSGLYEQYISLGLDDKSTLELIGECYGKEEPVENGVLDTVFSPEKQTEAYMHIRLLEEQNKGIDTSKLISYSNGEVNEKKVLFVGFEAQFNLDGYNCIGFSDLESLLKLPSKLYNVQAIIKASREGQDNSSGNTTNLFKGHGDLSDSFHAKTGSYYIPVFHIIESEPLDMCGLIYVLGKNRSSRRILSVNAGDIPLSEDEISLKNASKIFTYFHRGQPLNLNLELLTIILEVVNQLSNVKYRLLTALNSSVLTGDKYEERTNADGSKDIVSVIDGNNDHFLVDNLYQTLADYNKIKNNEEANKDSYYNLQVEQRNSPKRVFSFIAESDVDKLMGYLSPVNSSGKTIWSKSLDEGDTVSGIKNISEDFRTKD